MEKSMKKKKKILPVLVLFAFLVQLFLPIFTAPVFAETGEAVEMQVDEEEETDKDLEVIDEVMVEDEMLELEATEQATLPQTVAAEEIAGSEDSEGGADVDPENSEETPIVDAEELPGDERENTNPEDNADEVAVDAENDPEAGDGEPEEGKPTDLGNIFSEVKLMLGKDKIPEGSTITIDEDTEIVMELDWSIADTIDLKAGDYAEIAIPDVLKTVKDTGNLVDPDDQNNVVGTYTFAEGLLKVEFNEKLVGKENRRGAVGLLMTFTLAAFDNEVKQEIEFIDPLNKTFIVKAKVDGVDLKKKGVLPDVANPKTINWSIDVNTNRDDLTNAVVKDVIPAGLALDISSIEVYKLQVNRNGEVIGETPVENLTIKANESGFTVGLGDTDEAYRIQYSTTITDYEVAGYTNQATLEVENKTKATAKDTIDPIEKKSSIEKTGELDSQRNPKNITWTIDINKAEQTLTNAKVSDQLPDGLKSPEITIYELNYEKGKWIPSQESVFNEQTGFPLSLGTIDKAYRIIVKTAIDFNYFESIDDFINKEGGVTYENTATLTAEGIDFENPNYTDNAEVTAEWDELVTKAGKDVTSYGQRQMEWTVTMNKGQLPINDAKFIDIVGSGHEFLEITEIKKGSKTVTDYDVVTDQATLEGWNLSLPEGLSNDQITFGIDFGKLTEEVTITYRTKITDTTIDSYTNRALLYGWIGESGEGPGVGEDGRIPYLEDQSAAGKLTIKNKYIKTAKPKEINYKDKTMSWEIVVDAVAEEIKELTIEDTFADKYMLLKGEPEVFVTGQVEKLTPGADGDYTFQDKGVEGFTIEFKNDHKPLKRAKYTIKFKTSFDPDEVLAVEGGILNTNKNYKNNVTFTGKTATNNNIEVKKSANQNLIKWMVDRGQKKGKLIKGANADERKISWEIHLNPLGQKLIEKEFKITDELSEGQLFDKDSFEIYEYSLSTSGDTIKGNPIDKGRYVLNTDSKEYDFTLTFAGGIEEPILLEFDSKIEGISKAEYENSATVTIGTDSSEPYKDSVTYGEYDNFVEKGSNITGDTVYADSEIEWTVAVNKSLSDIKEAEFKDMISDGHLLIHDSVRVNGMEIEKEKLSIEDQGDGKTELTITLDDITKDQIITYKTVVVVTGGSISNIASLSGVDVTSAATSEKTYQARSASWGTGSGNDPRGSIEITKVDENNKPITLPAEFELYYKFEVNGKVQIIREERKATENGKVKYDKLPIRTYYLQETKAPKGYELNKEPLEIRLSKGSKETRYVERKVENIKKKIDKIGKKYWIDGPEERPTIKLQLYQDGEPHRNPVELTSGTTEYTWEGLDLTDDENEGKEHVYTVKEVDVPAGYTTKAEDLTVTNTVKKGNVAFTKVNTSGKGLKGAEFKIYRSTDTKFETPIKADNADEDGVIVSNEEGKVIFEGLNYNDYIIKETKAPSGYYRTNQSIEVSFDDFISAEEEATESVVVMLEDVKNNRIVYGRDTLELVKVGEAGESDYLSGAIFELLQNGEVKYTSEATGSDGRVKFNNLTYGTYTVREKEAPEGYTLDPDIQEVTITTGGALKTLTFTNNKIRGNIKLIKTDDAELPEGLAGAEFTLYNSAGEPVKTAISKQNGEVLFEDVVFGDYTLRETKAPEGYELNEEEFAVAITEEGVTVKEDKNGIALRVENKKIVEEPEDPDPEEPTEPEDPDPEEPTEPEDPGPEKPEDPEEPEDPKRPGDVEGAERPDGSDRPGDADKPEDPTRPGGAQNPGKPGEAEGAGKPGVSKDPAAAERAEAGRLPQTGEAPTLFSSVLGIALVTIGLGTLYMKRKIKE